MPCEFKRPPLDKHGHPEWLPVLTAKDMCKGRYVRGDQACLLGWAFRVATSTNAFQMASECYRPIVDEIERIIETHVIHVWNDGHTAAQRAALWNLAARNLGYVVPFEVDA